MLPTKRFFILDLPYCVGGIDLGRIWIEETASQRTLEKRADVAGARWVAQFAQRLGLNLANALTREREHLADFFEGARIAGLKPKTHADDAFFAGIELLQHGGHRLLQAEADGCIRWRGHGLVFDEIAQVSVFLFADRSLERNRRLRDLASPAHFFDAHVHPLGQLFRGGLAAKFLHESAAAPSELGDDLDHLNAHTNCTT